MAKEKKQFENVPTSGQVGYHAFQKFIATEVDNTVTALHRGMTGTNSRVKSIVAFTINASADGVHYFKLYDEDASLAFGTDRPVIGFPLRLSDNAGQECPTICQIHGHGVLFEHGATPGFSHDAGDSMTTAPDNVLDRVILEV